MGHDIQISGGVYISDGDFITGIEGQISSRGEGLHLPEGYITRNGCDFIVFSEYGYRCDAVVLQPRVAIWIEADISICTDHSIGHEIAGITNGYVITC